MNILITGSEGQLALELKKKFKNKHFNLFFFNKKQLDITKYKILEKKINLHKPSIIINCAAFTNVDKSEILKEIAYNINYRAVSNIVKLCNKNKIYLIHFSTDYVFGGSKILYKENDLTKPINYYGKTKKLGENLIKNNLKNYTIFRISWLMSKYKNNFLKTINNKLKKNRKIYVVNDQISNPTTTILVAKIINQTCENYYNKKNVLKGIFHLAGEPSLSKFEFVKYVYNRMKKLGFIKSHRKIIPINSSIFDTNTKRPKNSSFNLKKIKNKLNLTNISWKMDVNRILNEINE